MMVKHTRARRQSRMSIATIIPIRLKNEPKSCVIPCESSWFRVSTSFVTRLIRSPTGRLSKYPSGSRRSRSKMRPRSEARTLCPTEPTCTIWPREARVPKP